MTKRRGRQARNQRRVSAFARTLASKTYGEKHAVQRATTLRNTVANLKRDGYDVNRNTNMREWSAA